MSSLLHIKTTVLPGHRIEFSAPELQDGQAVDIVVTPVDTKRIPVAVDRQQLLKLPLAERRQALFKIAELLENEYHPDPERDAWQGGDILAD